MVDQSRIPAFLPSFAKSHNRSLNEKQRAWLKSVLPKYNVDEEDFDLAGAFGSQAKKYWFEIGAGNGEHALHQAKLYPSVGLIVGEVYPSGLAAITKVIEQETIQNVRLFTKDARLLLQALPEESLSRIYVLFPDPWPKRRHHKRRLVQVPTLKLMHSRLKAGGELRIATDSIDYCNWMMAHAVRVPELTWDGAWKEPFESHIKTRYQSKAEKNHRAIHYLRFFLTSDKKHV